MLLSSNNNGSNNNNRYNGNIKDNLSCRFTPRFNPPSPALLSFSLFSNNTGDLAINIDIHIGVCVRVG